MADILKDLEIDETRYIALLDRLIGVASFLQNNPQQGLIPMEDKASDIVIEALMPYTQPNGPLSVERVTYVEGRGNLIIKYPGASPGKVCSFVGSHMDVVPASAEGWSRDPFKLIIEGDMLYGRGTTDCLGHVALITDLFISLALKKPVLQTEIVAIFIANEENSVFLGVGIDQLAKEGYMDNLKTGPVFWVDSADSQPCVGTAGVAQWQLDFKGKLFHSGMPNRGINAIEFAQDSISYIQKRFYVDYKKHPDEITYNFMTSSTLKPTQISCTQGSINQIPPGCCVQGDIRLVPFYDISDVMKSLEAYVRDINASPSIVESGAHGPHSKYELVEEELKGLVKLTWITPGENGIACDLSSRGLAALAAATTEVLGVSKHYAINGSLPLIRDLKDQGFDVQIVGFGLSAKYHADNEAASLQGMKNAGKILSKVMASLEKENSSGAK